MISQTSSSPTARRNPYTCQHNIKLFFLSFSSILFPLTKVFLSLHMKGMGCPPSGARSGGHPTSTTRPSLNDEITSHLLQACHSPSCQCRLYPKAGGRPAPGPEGWGCKRWHDSWKHTLDKSHHEMTIWPVWIKHMLGGLGRVPLLK